MAKMVAKIEAITEKKPFTAHAHATYSRACGVEAAKLLIHKACDKLPRHRRFSAAGVPEISGRDP